MSGAIETWAPLSRQICFCKSPQVSGKHLVARAEHDRRIVAVRFHVGREASRAEIAGKKPVTSALRAAREFLARHILSDLERKSAIQPQLANRAPDGLFHSDTRRMIVSSMHNRDSGMPTHEQLHHALAVRRHPGRSQSFFNDRGNDGDRLRPADQRIFELTRVHFHDEWVCIRFSSRISGAAVIPRTPERFNGDPYFVRFQRRLAINRSFLSSIGDRNSRDSRIRHSQSARALRLVMVDPSCFSE